MNFGFVFKTTGGPTVNVSESFEFEDSKPFIPYYSVVEDITFDARAAGCVEGTKCYNTHPPYAGTDSEVGTILVPPNMDVTEHGEVLNDARFNYNIDQVQRTHPLLDGTPADDEEGCIAYFGKDLGLASISPKEILGENTYTVSAVDFNTTEPMPAEFCRMVLRAGEDRILRTKADELRSIGEIAGDIEHSYAGELDFSDFKLNTKLVVIVAKIILRQKSITRSNLLDPVDVLHLHVLEALFREEFISSQPSFITGYNQMLFGAAIALVCTGIITQ